ALGVPAQHDAVRAVDDVPVSGLVGAQPGDLVPELPDLQAEPVRVPGRRHGAALHHGRPAGFKARRRSGMRSGMLVDADAARPLASPVMRFAGRIAVVTGAASGIGKATALRLGREGAAVAAVDRHLAGAEETAAALRNAGG